MINKGGIPYPKKTLISMVQIIAHESNSYPRKRSPDRAFALIVLDRDLGSAALIGLIYYRQKA